jgi:dUTP diphosphatase
MYLRYAKTREVNVPSRAHPTDAGIDFFVPKLDKKYLEDLDANPANSGVMIKKNDDGTTSLVVPVGANVCLPSGIKVEIPYGFMGLFLNKSGFASKKDGIMGAQVIDTFYAGEVHLDIHNIGTAELFLKEGDKVTQMVMVPIATPALMECEEEELYADFKLEAYRGEKGFGSSDNSKKPS